uniref:Uncharacterized protein n=1 Tax=Klebsiella phage JLBP1001 TaxID=3236746 RepID=A0AB39C8K5_9CAUD
MSFSLSLIAPLHSTPVRFVEVIIAKPIGLVLTKNAIPAIADYSTDSE